MQVNVKSVSAAGTNRYLLKLSCGHQKIVRRLQQPTRKTCMCGECQLEANDRTHEIERLAIAICRREGRPWESCSQGLQEAVRKEARHKLGIGT